MADLRELGYVEGKNLVIEIRWADGKYDWLPALSVERVTKLQLVINAKTADALGVAIPQSLLVRADEIIR